MTGIHQGASSAQAPSTDFSFNTSAKPKVMTSEPTSNTSALGKSPVYSPLGSSAHEVYVTLNPNSLLVVLETCSFLLAMLTEGDNGPCQIQMKHTDRKVKGPCLCLLLSQHIPVDSVSILPCRV